MRIAVNGVTGRMGRLHLTTLAHLRDGGADVSLIAVGRDADRVAPLAEAAGASWTSSLSEAIASCDVFCDAQATVGRADRLREALAAGKHVFTEKPLADDLSDALDLVERARTAGVVTAQVHDKIYYPGLVGLRDLIASGRLGRILSLSIDFGYWVFPDTRAQRPSWFYRAADGGGLVLDMFPHFSYMTAFLVGDASAVSAHATTRFDSRVDERGESYVADTDDDVVASLEFPDGVSGLITASWARRPERDELIEIVVDGTEGSARAGYFTGRLLADADTPRARWDPNGPVNLKPGWEPLELPAPVDPAVAQWTQFLADVAAGRLHAHDFASGARGVALVDAALASVRERRWVAVPKV